MTQAARDHLSRLNTGKKHSPEAVAKIVAASTGRNNGRFKDEKIIHPSGYVLVYVDPEHPMAGRVGNSRCRVYEHRLVMSESLGRPLTRHEVVHHIDGDKTNNSLSNLRLFKTARDHSSFHQTELRSEIKRLRAENEELRIKLGTQQ